MFRTDLMNKYPCELPVAIPPTWSGKGGNGLLGNSCDGDNLKESKIYLSAFFFFLSVKTLHLG